MGLNIFGFQTEFKPHYSHQFKVQISNSDATDNNVVEYNVKSIKLPQFSINTEIRNYGNTSLGLPVFSFGDQYLEITFVETENFIVLETFLSKMSWTSSSPISKTYIIVEEYDETMSTLIRKHRYIGRVVEVGNPSWQRSGSAGYIELTVKFLVDSNKIEGATTNTFVGVAASNTVKQNNDLTGETLDEGRDYAAAQSEYASFENNVRNSIASSMASAQQAEDQQRQAAQNQTQELDAERQRQDDANRAKKAAEEAKKKQQEQQAAAAAPAEAPAAPSGGNNVSSREGGGSSGSGSPGGSKAVGVADASKVKKNGKTVYDYFQKTDNLVYGWGGKLKNLKNLQDTTVKRGVNEVAGGTARKKGDRDIGHKGIDCLGWVFGAIAYTGGSIEIDGVTYSGEKLIQKSKMITTKVLYKKLKQGKVKVNVTKESGIKNVYVKDGHIVLENTKGEIMESAGGRSTDGHTGVQAAKKKLGKKYIGTGINVA